MSILVNELACQQGRLGHLTLDAPASLNALSEAMLDDLLSALDRWEQDEQVCLVLLDSRDDTAFCSGADLKTLYQALGEGDNRTVEGIFSREYRLMYRLHRYPKPVVALAEGVAFGAGMGLLSACRYRLVGPEVALAMPEVRIGLLPDVGASWFLNRLPAGLGLFLGLTGAQLNTSDALRVGLADLAVPAQSRQALVSQIQAQAWTGRVAADDNRLHRLINQFASQHPTALPDSQLAQHEQAIAHLCRQGALPDIVDRLLAADEGNDWWQACIANLRQGCPVTPWLVSEQLQRGQQMSLRDSLTMELALALNCSQAADFREGIRARLIDRDQSPRWQHGSVREVPGELVESRFAPPWGHQPSPLDLV
ncbi:enoyl-CoA hydratase/isomerase family protein [Marinobacter xestospongiae]|uniref:3-hydroxyisobutyryl-CoA hydrolase n=1 Tax=Marinobacter xestospongiae TaxID=994319 RepID=A0ABU3VX28_9GAMM|nr:enoyl-CoA hydratase/isomerase family protein [Marinobacter xestospongiae]MDV2078828.1 enoyl-CoA hydratase/isomerase family protein [Marinobacter xestospongiae]